jgi:hypothetical protein
MTKRIALFSLLVGLSSLARADSPPAGEHPCAKLKAACEAAGFVKGGAKSGKGLLKDCMLPVMAGHPIAGVTVDPADVQACKAKHPMERPPQ